MKIKKIGDKIIVTKTGNNIIDDFADLLEFLKIKLYDNSPFYVAQIWEKNTDPSKHKPLPSTIEFCANLDPNGAEQVIFAVYTREAEMIEIDLKVINNMPEIYQLKLRKIFSEKKIKI